MPYDTDLAERMRDVLAPFPGITERKMFGGLCFFVNGNMLSGVETGRFMFRVGKLQEPVALTRPGAEPIIFAGRRMGGMIWVDAGCCDLPALCRWALTAMDFAGCLPPKEPTRRSKTKKQTEKA